jgi:hypothetical protein
MSDVTHSIIGDIRFGARQLRRNLPLTTSRPSGSRSDWRAPLRSRG